MCWTVGKVSLASYTAFFLGTVALALEDQLGSVTLVTATDWILAVWLAGYATISFLLIFGSAVWVFEVLAEKMTGHEYGFFK